MQHCCESAQGGKNFSASRVVVPKKLAAVQNNSFSFVVRTRRPLVSRGEWERGTSHHCGPVKREKKAQDHQLAVFLTLYYQRLN